MTDNGSSAAAGDAGGDRLSWTHVYLQFSLPEPDRRALDEYLLARNTSLGQILHRALTQCLTEADIDPARLQRPPDDVGGHHH